MAASGIVDADGHVTESTEQLAAYIDPAWRDYGPWPGARTYYPMDAWDRSARGTLGETAGSAKTWLEALDRGGLECTVLYPTAGLAIGWVREPGLAVALCRAYNDFFHHELAAASPRLKGVALLPLQDPAAAVAELRRARGLGAVGAMLPTVGLRKPLGHPTSGRSTPRPSGWTAWSASTPPSGARTSTVPTSSTRWSRSTRSPIPSVR